MKKSLLIFICFIFIGCATTMSELTAPNRTNLLKLSIGMDKAKVLETMGTQPFHNSSIISSVDNKYAGTTVTNPYRSEILQGKDKTFEIIYYVTDVKSTNGTINDEDMTPLIFDNGKLIGWGWRFLNDNVQKYEIKIR